MTLLFELHNRHTYSEDLVKAKKAFRQYTATVGVLTMDNTLVDRAVIQSEFRSEADLFDRIAGGAAPGGVKAVAPSGTEFITIELPEDVGEQVSILGEKLTVLQARRHRYLRLRRPAHRHHQQRHDRVTARVRLHARRRQPPAKKP